MQNSSNKPGSNEHLTRRRLLRGIGAVLAVAPLGALLGCSDAASTEGSGGGGGSGGSGGGDTTSGTTSGTGSSAGGWATGGTASMKGGYPDPFTDDLGSACALTCSATLGPCYAKTLERKDITEGHDGLPTRLAFRVVDDACKPIEGATVDIWHAGPEGVYSGDDSVQMCTLDDEEALASRWFRGVQTTDANGRVDFDTCFPGWYSGRTVHIHLTVRVGGQEYVTSQLVFDDALVDAIVATQPIYSDRGARDTNNTNDNVVSADSAADYSFETKQMDDGAMLAWKTLVIRSSLNDALCQIPGGMGGPGGPGGP